MNHHSRQIAAPAISADKARQSIPEGLTIESEHLVYIPTTGQNEVLCWEFICKSANGGQVLLYMNAETGQTENILLLIESETGVLTR